MEITVITIYNNRVIQYLNTVLEDSKLIVEIPFEVYDELYRKASENFALPIIPEYLSVMDILPVKCKARLNIGESTFTAIITLHWRDIKVEVQEKVLCLLNPNLVSINVKFATIGEDGTLRLVELEIDRLGESCLGLEQLGVTKARVVVQYTLLNTIRSRVVQIE